MTTPPPTGPRATRTRQIRRGNDTATNLAIFATTFLLSAGGGYLLFNQPQKQATTPTSVVNVNASPAAATPAATPEETAATPAASNEGEIFAARGCVGCHSVAALGVKGGVTGPDLSNAYLNVADKHGVPIEEFLKKPTSAVMSGVLGGNPLTDDELTQVLAALKVASEKQK